MKLKRLKILVVLAFTLAGGWAVLAQADNGGTTDFSAFKLVTDRNIFDPNRYPHSSRSSYRPTHRHTHSASAPAFALVGTMNYHKGMFAFFDGNDSDYRKILQRNGVVAGYTVTEITLAGVKLQAGTNSIEMRIGAQMRQDGGVWELADADEPLISAGPAANVPSSANENNSTPPSGAADSGAPVSDVLKRLMQLRAQENQ